MGCVYVHTHTHIYTKNGRWYINIMVLGIILSWLFYFIIIYAQLDYCGLCWLYFSWNKIQTLHNAPVNKYSLNSTLASIAGGEKNALTTRSSIPIIFHQLHILVSKHSFRNYNSTSLWRKGPRAFQNSFENIPGNAASWFGFGYTAAT